VGWNVDVTCDGVEVEEVEEAEEMRLMLAATLLPNEALQNRTVNCDWRV
jgi:hypothetical protein